MNAPSAAYLELGVGNEKDGNENDGIGNDGIVTDGLASGPAADHVLAFDRGGVTTVATRLAVGLERRGGWADTSIEIGGTTTDVVTGRRVAQEVALADLLSDYPVALLVR